MRPLKKEFITSRRKGPLSLVGDTYSTLSHHRKEELIDRQLKELAGMLIEQFVKRKRMNGRS